MSIKDLIDELEIMKLHISHSKLDSAFMVEDLINNINQMIHILKFQLLEGK